MTTPPLPLPLAGVRVLDVSQVMAGPFACMLFGDMGADVIKVEPPKGGDQTRGSMGFKLKGDDSMGFLNMNRNKRSVALNLKSEAGREVMWRLVESADILVENYRPGVMKRLGFGYDACRARNPGLVYASISGFGQTGPWADRPGFDLMAQAMSGVMSVTGYPGGPPVKCGRAGGRHRLRDVRGVRGARGLHRPPEVGRGPARGRGAVRRGDGVLGVGHLRILGHGQAARAARHGQQDDARRTRRWKRRTAIS